MRALALSGTDGFVAAIPGPAVLVRLDERGGPLEGAPWAFPSLERVESLLADNPGDDDIFLSLEPGFAASSDEATATGPAQPPLPMPPARERATAYVVPRGGGRVGRAATSAVRVDERSVSRQHAMLGADDDGYSLVDLDSDNGTAINGMQLMPGAPQQLRSGDVVLIADVSFLFIEARALASHLSALVGQ